jgi:hypothetical protein
MEIKESGFSGRAFYGVCFLAVRMSIGSSIGLFRWRSKNKIDADPDGSADGC